MTAQYVKTSPPHILSGVSVPKKIRGTVFALLPVLLASALQDGWNTIRIFLMAVLAASAAEILPQILFRKKPTFHHGSFIHLAILFSLMLPLNLPSWIVFFGSFVSVVIGKELFGGLGSFIFQPVLLGYLVLELNFPRLMNPSDAAAGWNFTLPLFKNPSIDIHLTAVVISAILLFWQRLIRIENAFIFLAGIALLGPPITGKEVFELFSSQVLLSAFFYLEMIGLGPLTAAGRKMFAVVSSLITVVLWKNLSYFTAFSCAVLLMNAMTPWLDEWVRPKLSRLTKNL